MPLAKKSTKNNPVDEDADTDTEIVIVAEESAPEVEVGTGALKVRVRRSVSATYENGVLDNWVAEIDVEIPSGTNLDDMQAEINRAHVAAAFAIGAPYTAGEDGNVLVGLPPYNGTAVGRSSGASRAVSGASDATRKMGGKPAAPARRSGGGGGGGGARREANYTTADREALWDQFRADVEAAGNDFPADGWFDNTSGDWPNVKPKPKILDALDINAEPKPLYLKSAPKDIKEMFDFQD